MEKVKDSSPVLVLTLRQVDGKPVAAGYDSTYGNMVKFFLKTKNPREKGYRQINVYVKTKYGHEFWGWSAASGISHYTFDFSLNFDDMYDRWIQWWEEN